MDSGGWFRWTDVLRVARDCLRESNLLCGPTFDLENAGCLVSIEQEKGPISVFSARAHLANESNNEQVSTICECFRHACIVGPYSNDAVIHFDIPESDTPYVVMLRARTAEAFAQVLSISRIRTPPRACLFC